MHDSQKIKCRENTYVEGIDYQGIPWETTEIRENQRILRHNINLYKEFPSRPLNKLKCQNQVFKKYLYQYQPFRIKRFHQVSKVYSSLAHPQLRHNLSCSFIPNTVFYTDSQNMYMYDYQDRRLQKFSLNSDFQPAGISIMGSQCVLPSLDSSIYILNLVTGEGSYQKIINNGVGINQALLYSKKHQYDQHKLLTSQMVQINDFELFVCDNNNNLFIYDLGAHSPKYTYEHDSYINRIAHSPDQNLLALCSDSEFVHLLDYKNNLNVLKLIGHTDYSFAAAFNPLKPWELATGNQDTTAIIWDIRNPKIPIVQIKTVYFAAYHLSYTNDSNYLLVGEAFDTLSIYSSQECQVIVLFQQFEFFGQISGVAHDLYNQKMFSGVIIREYDGIFEIDQSITERSLLNNLNI